MEIYVKYNGYIFKIDNDLKIEYQNDNNNEEKDNLKFRIEVSDVSSMGWKQIVVAEIGNLEEYKIEYNISTIGFNTATETTVLNDMQNKLEGTSYYVWAIANKDGKKIKSDNYVIVNTSHKHIGNAITGGECYSKNVMTCNNDLYYYVIGDSSKSVNGWYGIDSAKRYCGVCGLSESTMYRAQNGSTLRAPITAKIICSECGVMASYTTATNISEFTCKEHSQNWENGDFNITVKGKNYNYTNCLYIGPISFGNNLYLPANGSVVVTIEHDNIYVIDCGKTEQSASTKSENF